MLSEPAFTALITGVFTILGTILGASISGILDYINTRASDKEASKRLYDQHAMEQKFNSFQELYVKFDGVIARFQQANMEGINSFDAYKEEIYQPYLELQATCDTAMIYLEDEDEIETINETLEILNNNTIYLRTLSEVHDDSIPRQNVSQQYEVSHEKLARKREEVRDILKPKLDPSQVDR